MRAALTLRLIEARRRGGPWLAGAGFLVVGGAAAFAGETADGRYGLASDLAATFTYLSALFFGALPLATDRERGRSSLPGASPVRPWAWALGNALGAALIGLLCGLLLFSAAGVGAALRGGIETNRASPFEGRGTQWLPVRLTQLPPGTSKLRLVPRVHLKVDDPVGTTDSAPIEVGGTRYEVHPDQPIVVGVSGSRVLLRNLSEEHAVGIDRRESLALGAARSFLANAIGAGVAPALGAAALAAFAATASANLSAPVAALLTALVLVLSSLKGFVVETIEFQGSARRAKAEGAAPDPHHDRGPAPGDGAQQVSRILVNGLLHVVPDLAALDRTDRVALGQWTGLDRWGRALMILCAALFLAGSAGGFGVYSRRLP